MARLALSLLQSIAFISLRMPIVSVSCIYMVRELNEEGRIYDVFQRQKMRDHCKVHD